MCNNQGYIHRRIQTCKSLWALPCIKLKCWFSESSLSSAQPWNHHSVLIMNTAIWTRRRAVSTLSSLSRSMQFLREREQFSQLALTSPVTKPKGEKATVCRTKQDGQVLQSPLFDLTALYCQVRLIHTQCYMLYCTRCPGVGNHRFCSGSQAFPRQELKCCDLMLGASCQSCL